MINLSNEQKALLNLVAISISSNPASLVLQHQDLDGVDWLEVLKESVFQTVALSTLNALKFYKELVPEKVYSAWKGAGISVLKNNLSVTSYQAQLVDLLHKNKVDYCIIKGSSSASYYPNPEDRALGDIDFLIDSDNRENVENLLKENGYNMWETSHPSHSIFNKENAHLEMHFEIAGLPNNDKKEFIKEFVKPATKDAIKTTNQLGTFNAPSELYHGIIILLHMQHHMQNEGLGLRHVCDWACFVDKTYKMPFFSEQFLPFLKQIGLYKYAQVVTKLCVNYLGVVNQDWANDQPDELSNELLIDILKGGNFGLKDNSRANSAFMIAQKGEKDNGRMGNAFKVVHKIVLKEFPIVKKVWLLYPFIYAWKIVKYLFLMLIGKRKSVFKLMSTAKERKDVYSKLEIFTIKEEKGE